ncbi:PREDICTED: serine-rich adhesin for platelets-like isoform X2 [Trachymyrmex septentrionalis]|uniref:serine-rich adhesin for platelets-like isoform X2 n=1 Tax=Trachymyrmex septentrionalis TaxID=34720 RepID=UPI00084EDD41|nr:PREDICTED: serine-rich adhesin for platelets-like isoform X2 [Trachymyrmex septentrionalis]
MAENIEENINKSIENNMSEISTADDRIVSFDKENHEQINIDEPSSSKQALDATAEKEKIEDTDLHNSEQQNTSKTDCNGDLKEETNLKKIESGTTESEINKYSETNKFETKDSNSNEPSSTEAKMDDTIYATTLQSSLNEIIKVVHGDLAMEILRCANDTENNDEENNEKNQQTVRKEDVSKDDTADTAKECITFPAAEDKNDSRGSSNKTEERSNIGIVHSPTAFGELIEEQLANDSALSTDRADHIVEWVKNSVVNANKEGIIVEKSKFKMYEENTTSEAEKRKMSTVTPPFISPKKSLKIVVNNIIKKSIKCLNNKMHAMEGATESKRKVDTAEDDKTSRSSPSPKVPQSQQNGAALPEETAAAPTASVGRPRKKKDDSRCDTETPNTKGRQLLASTSRQSVTTSSDVVQPRRHIKAGSEPVEIRKRKSTLQVSPHSGNPPKKKFRDNYTREEYISNIVGDDNESIEDLVAKADRLRADILTLENLAHAKEMEWNEILRKRKLKEEAYQRLERKIQTTAYMENDGQLSETLPPRSSVSSAEWENNGNSSISKERSFEIKEDLGERSSDSSGSKKEKTPKASSQQRATPPKTNGESNRKQNEVSSPESRQIGEGRQGAIVDVRSIIADHRLKHPETVPRRGRRLRNSNVNINLGAGGAMVETGHNADSRPSSTESCKSNPSTNDPMNYKDMLVQFAKLSQQGEPVKIPQNYPDVTLHPVTLSSTQNTSQPTGSLLHGILTKAQTPRSSTFSPTLARLLTAPERERSSPAAAAAAAVATSASMSQPSATTQHLLQTYQGSNMARTEITITPVVNTPAQSHSNDLIQVEDVEDETSVIDDRKGNSVIGRDGKQMVKDNPPSPNAPPKCQGCIIRPAQFVCAGCGNQWYCSRSCQVHVMSSAHLLHGQHTPIIVRRSPRIAKQRPMFNSRDPCMSGVYNGIRREIST